VIGRARMSRKLLLLAAMGLLALSLAGTVRAFLTATATSGSSGEAVAGTVGAPDNPTAPAYSDTGQVTLEWGAATLADGSPVLGYYVTRTDTATHATDAACGTDSTNLTSELTCTDGVGSGSGGLPNPTVPDGSYVYTVTSAYHLWGTASEGVGPVVVDTVAPTSTLAFPGSAGPFDAAAWTAGCDVEPFHASGTICGTADGTGTGVGGMTVSIQSTSGPTAGMYWGGSAFDQPAETGSALRHASSGDGFLHWTLAFPIGDFADGSYVVRVHATDAAGNTQTATTAQDFAIDTTAPTTTDNASPGWRNTDVTVALTPDDGAGSGVAATYYTTDGSKPAEVGGVPEGTTRKGTSVVLSADGIYTIKYFSIDNAGNAESVETATNQVMIDKTAPDPGAVVTDGAYVSGGGTTFVATGQPLTDTTTLDPTVDGASSGVASVAYLYCAVASDPGGATCTPTHPIGGRTSPDYSVPWDTRSLADGRYRLIATVLDNAGNSASSPIVPVTVDNSAPTTTDDSATIGSRWFDTAQTVTLTPSDNAGGSGVAATYFTTDGSTPTTSSASGTSVVLSSDGIYAIEYRSVDNLGNTETPAKTAATAIHVDTHAPDPGAVVTAGAYVAGGTTFIETGQPLTDTTAADPTVNDASSGVAEVAYYYCRAGCTGTPASDPANWTAIGSPATSAPYTVGWDNHALADGAYGLIAGATDVAGNTGYSSIQQVTVDNTTPAAAFTFPTAGGFYDAARWDAIAGTADDGSGSGVSAVMVAIQDGSGDYYDGTGFDSAAQTFLPTSGTTAWSYAIEPGKLTDGHTYHVTVETTDNLADTDAAASTRSFTYDTTGPSTTVMFPADGGSYQAAGWTSGAPILGTATDATSGIGGTASIILTITQTGTGDTWNGASFAAGSATVHPTTFSAGVWTYAFPDTDFPADGTYTVSVTATDQAGNAGPASDSTFAYDPTAPAP